MRTLLAAWRRLARKGLLTARRANPLRRTLARSYNDESHLDSSDHEKLQMLETYLQMQAQGAGAEEAAAEPEMEMPTRPEDVSALRPMLECWAVPPALRSSCGSLTHRNAAHARQVDKFMAELAAAAAGGLPPVEEAPAAEEP